MGETSDAYKRRVCSFFFEKYLRGYGIDIGCGREKITEDTIGYDYDERIPEVIHGDATHMREFEDETFDYVYSSHCLEDIVDADTALKNWYRILKTGGYLIISVPHRDYAEQVKVLPSNINKRHKRLFLPFIEEPPDTISLYHFIVNTLPNAYIVYLNECCELTIPKRRVTNKAQARLRRTFAGVRERSIETVIQKGKYTSIFELEEGLPHESSLYPSK